MAQTGWVQRLGGSFREYTAGFRLRDAVRELERDASQTYRTLTRDHADTPEPKGRLARAWHRGKVVFLGLSAKLTPARRILFLVCLVAALLGLVGSPQPGAIVQMPGLLLVSVLGLVFLLALELADRVLVRDELEVARQLQRELLPRDAPDLPGWEFAFSYRTANTIGGDYYDFLPVSDGRVALVIGDASGHGIAAGLLMAIANSTLKLALDLDPRPAAVANLVNRALVRTGSPRDFMTLFVGLLDPDSGHIEYVCAGHPFPLVLRSDGVLKELGTGSLPLGMWPDVRLDVGEVTITRGDVLVLYSDGIPETIDATEESFGFERLQRAVSLGGTAQAVHERVVSSVEAFRNGHPLIDDRSLLVVARLAAP